MNYVKEDINFGSITPQAFENLCYDLLVKYGFKNITWRQGGADAGRDIEGVYTNSTPFGDYNSKWFFECKRYEKGVPPEDLQSKIAWADAELPDYLVLFTSSYLTLGCRFWLKKIESQKAYQIIVIDGENLKDRLLNYPEIVERYFSQEAYDKLLKDIKDYKKKFNVNPSYEFLTEIIQNINLEKLDNEDIGFLLINFYKQYKLFESRDEYYGDFDPRVVNRLLDYLADTLKNEALASFEPYKKNYDNLGGDGFIEEMYFLDGDEDYIMDRYDFQISDLHLNHRDTQENWKIGDYLFVIHKDIAIELFRADATEIRIIRDFNDKQLDSMSIFMRDEFKARYPEYLLKAKP